MIKIDENLIKVLFISHIEIDGKPYERKQQATIYKDEVVIKNNCLYLAVEGGACIGRVVQKYSDNDIVVEVL